MFPCEWPAAHAAICGFCSFYCGTAILMVPQGNSMVPQGKKLRIFLSRRRIFLSRRHEKFAGTCTNFVYIAPLSPILSSMYSFIIIDIGKRHFMAKI